MEDKILVNDIIVINKKNCGMAYSSCNRWFDSYRISTKNYSTPLSNHVKNDGIEENYRCIWVAPHPAGHEIVYAIEGIDTKKVFLVAREAILTYSHTPDSYDNTEKALHILTATYHELGMVCDDLSNTIEEYKKELITLGDMPQLKDDMYGTIIDKICVYPIYYKFRVARGAIFMDNGYVYNIDDFKNGCYKDFEIVELKTNVKNFAQYYCGDIIWRKD